MIPISTTTVTVHGVRPQSDVDPDADGYDAPADPPTVLASGVRATLTLPQGKRSNPTDEILSYKLRMDLVENFELTRYDSVTDDSTGTTYQVEEVALSLPEQFGLSHWVATLRLGKGIVDAEDVNEFARD